MTPRLTILTLAVCAIACGSSGGSGATVTTPTVNPSVTTTSTLSGTTRQMSVHGCSGDSHELTVADGELSITLLETSDAAGALSVQVCQGPNDTGLCTIKQQRINVGQKLSGPRVGSATQIVKMLPFTCVFTDSLDTTPVTYKVSVTYQK